MSNDPFYSSEATLPNNFAEKVLEAEMMLDEGQVDLQTIQNLNELYKVWQIDNQDSHRILHSDRCEEGHPLPEKANSLADQSDDITANFSSSQDWHDEGSNPDSQRKGINAACEYRDIGEEHDWSFLEEDDKELEPDKAESDSSGR